MSSSASETIAGSGPSIARNPDQETMDRAAVKMHQIMVEDSRKELTIEEQVEYEAGWMTWGKIKKWRFWLRREWWYIYILAATSVTLAILLVVFHHPIVHWIEPFAHHMRTIRAGFLIPTAVILVLSVPPLGGNEIIIILTGLIWGLGRGFGIATVGTIIGESIAFWMFHQWFRPRALEMSMRHLLYSSVHKAVLEGGWVLATIIKLSGAPSNFTTAIFASCGQPFHHFPVSFVLSLPKTLALVYMGVVFGNIHHSSQFHIVSSIVLALIGPITVGCGFITYVRLSAARKTVIIQRRKRSLADNLEVIPTTSGENIQDVETL